LVKKKERAGKGRMNTFSNKRATSGVWWRTRKVGTQKQLHAKKKGEVAIMERRGMLGSILGPKRKKEQMWIRASEKGKLRGGREQIKGLEGGKQVRTRRNTVEPLKHKGGN